MSKEYPHKKKYLKLRGGRPPRTTNKLNLSHKRKKYRRIREKKMANFYLPPLFLTYAINHNCQYSHDNKIKGFYMKAK